jgi:hypothetical protein
MSIDKAVAVFGATGHTGRFVIAELLRRGFKAVAIGRDATRLAASEFPRDVSIKLGSIDDPASLDRALVGVAAVINCAGPFLDTAHAVASAAMRAHIHYLDVTAEQASAHAMLDHFGAAAADAGIVVMPAMGFYGGFLDLLATAATAGWDSVDDIRIGIALDRWWPTPGTRHTGRRNTAQRLVVNDGRLVPLVPTAPSSWSFASPFGNQDMTEVPFSEMILIARHIRASHVRTYLNDTSLRDVRDPATPPPTPIDEARRSAQTFLVELDVRKGSERRHVMARGRDIYAFTAPLVVEAVHRILTGKVTRYGAAAPGEIFEAAGYLSALTPELEWRSDS